MQMLPRRAPAHAPWGSIVAMASRPKMSRPYAGTTFSAHGGKGEGAKAQGVGSSRGGQTIKIYAFGRKKPKRHVGNSTVFVTSDALHIRPDPAVQARGAGSFKTDAKPSRLFLGPETDQPFGQTGRREVATIEDLARAAKLASILRREFPARQDNHWDLRASRQGANAL